MAETYTSKYATGTAVDAALDKAESALQAGDVVNALDSTATDAPLSAAQGKALNEAKIGGSTGAVDNAVLRADGTGTKTAQAGGLVLVLGDDGSMQFTGTAAAPNAPGSGAIDLVTARTSASSIAGGSKAIAIGNNCAATDSGAVAIGDNCVSSGNRSFSTGYYTRSLNAGQFATGFIASGFGAGNSQANSQVMGGTTTNADAKVLTIDDSTRRLLIPSRRAIAFTGLVTAMSDSTDGYKVAAWEIKGILTRDDSNNTRIVGTPTIASLGADAEAAGWAVSSITADDTNETLSITVTGEAATNIRWNVSLFYGQIGYA